MARVKMYMTMEAFNVYEEGRTAYGQSYRDDVSLVEVSIHASEVFDMKRLTTAMYDPYTGRRRADMPFVEYRVKKVKGIGD